MPRPRSNTEQVAAQRNDGPKHNSGIKQDEDKKLYRIRSLRPLLYLRPLQLLVLSGEKLGDIEPLFSLLGTASSSFSQMIACGFCGAPRGSSTSDLTLGRLGLHPTEWLTRSCYLTACRPMEAFGTAVRLARTRINVLGVLGTSSFFPQLMYTICFCSQIQACEAGSPKSE